MMELYLKEIQKIHSNLLISLDMIENRIDDILDILKEMEKRNEAERSEKTIS